MMNQEWRVALLAIGMIVSLSGNASAQLFGHHARVQAAPCRGDVMDTRNYRLLDYRRMFMNGQTPTSADLVGHWRGVNKGVVVLLGYKQFIKEILPQDCELKGDNIMVHQVSSELLRCCGWQPKADPNSWDGLERNGKFAIQGAGGFGPFRHGVIFNYRRGNNPRRDPVRVIVDRVVKIDDNHLLGRATVNFGPLHIPVAYFVLERIDTPFYAMRHESESVDLSEMPLVPADT